MDIKHILRLWLLYDPMVKFWTVQLTRVTRVVVLIFRVAGSRAFENTKTSGTTTYARRIGVLYRYLMVI